MLATVKKIITFQYRHIFRFGSPTTGQISSERQANIQADTWSDKEIRRIKKDKSQVQPTFLH